MSDIDLSYRNLRETDQELINGFKCEDQPSVERFLKSQAIELQKLKLTTTRLYFNDNKELVGYFTLFNDNVEISNRQRKKHRWSDIPRDVGKGCASIQLHYMGVDSRYRDIGYGKYLMIEAIETVKESSELSGCAFITLQSYKNVIGFYNKFNFKRLNKDGTYIKMILRFAQFY